MRRLSQLSVRRALVALVVAALGLVALFGIGAALAQATPNAGPVNKCEYTAYDGGSTAVIEAQGSPNCTGTAFTINAQPYGGTTFDFYLQQLGEYVAGPLPPQDPQGLVCQRDNVYTNHSPVSVYEVPAHNGISGSFGMAMDVCSGLRGGSWFGAGVTGPINPAALALSTGKFGP